VERDLVASEAMGRACGPAAVISFRAVISVVIPHYNRQRFIDECLESVFAQTHPADEVIVVDDGSQPDQRRHLRKFVPRIRLVELPQNRGVSAARNAGIAAATGDWIAFQDSDDLWVPDKLAVQWEHLQRTPDSDGVHSAICAFQRDGRETVSDPIPPRLALADALRHNLIRVQSLLVRTAALRALGGFDESLRTCEDDDLGIRLALAGYRIDFMTRPLTRMRRWGHGHLFGDWRSMVVDKTRVALRHRAEIERVLGRGATRRRIALSVRKAGLWRGGVVGRLLLAGGWVLGGFDATTD
jgi:glycosyltransferase involved in cell wall biosynthesis